jgi:hypothetical protein
MSRRGRMEVQRMTTTALLEQLRVGVAHVRYEYGLNHFERDKVLDVCTDILNELGARNAQGSLFVLETPRS